MAKRILCLLLLLAWWNDPAAGQTGPWVNFVSLGARDVTADGRGGLWIAGGGGLSRYDWRTDRWSVYTVAEGLSRSSGRSVFVDEAGVWVGTEGGGASYFNPVTERFTPFLQVQISDRNPERRPTVTSLQTDDRYVWAGTLEGLFQTDRWTLKTLAWLTREDGLSEERVLDIDDDGAALWLATAFHGADFISPRAATRQPGITGGLTRIDKRTMHIESFRLKERSNNFTSVADAGDEVWVSGHAGLLRFHKWERKFESVAEEELGAVYDFVLDGEDVWCIDEGSAEPSLVRLSRGTGQIEERVPVPHGARGGRLAVTPTHVYLVTGNRVFEYPKSLFGPREIPTPHLPESRCSGMAADDRYGYAGCRSHLFVLDPLEPTIVESVELPGVSDVREITLHDDMIWAGTNNGLYEIDRADLTVRRHLLNGYSVSFTIRDGRYIWVNTTAGLHLVQRDTGNAWRALFYGELSTFGSISTHGLVLDGESMWMSFSGSKGSGIAELSRGWLVAQRLHASPTLQIGPLIDRGDYLLAGGSHIFRIHKDEFVVEPFIPRAAHDLAVRGDEIWALTPDGVIIYDYETGEEKNRLTQREGLLSDRFLRRLAFGRDHAWVSSSSGISAWDPEADLRRTDPGPPEILLPPFRLFVYPNPAHGRVGIRFGLDEPCRVTLEVFDTQGRRIGTVLSSDFDAGNHDALWDASMHAAGQYYIRMQACGRQLTRPVVLIPTNPVQPRW